MANVVRDSKLVDLGRCICSRRVTNLKRPTYLGSLAMSILTWTSLGHMPKNLELYFNDDQTIVLSFFQTKKIADNYFVKHKPIKTFSKGYVRCDQFFKWWIIIDQTQRPATFSTESMFFFSPFMFAQYIVKII